MKKIFYSVIALAIGSLTLAGAEFPVTNGTPFNITKIEMDDNVVYPVNIPAGKTQKISIPPKHHDDIELIFIFSNGKKASAFPDEMKDVKGIKIAYAPKYSTSSYKRSKKTKWAAGKVQFNSPSMVKISAIELLPLKKGNSRKCSLSDAKKRLYSVPLDGKYKIKFTTSDPKHPSLIFNNKGKGYDFKNIKSISLNYSEFTVNVDEPDLDDDDL